MILSRPHRSRGDEPGFEVQRSETRNSAPKTHLVAFLQKLLHVLTEIAVLKQVRNFEMNTLCVTVQKKGQKIGHFLTCPRHRCPGRKLHLATTFRRQAPRLEPIVSFPHFPQVQVRPVKRTSIMSIIEKPESRSGAHTKFLLFSRIS